MGNRKVMESTETYGVLLCCSSSVEDEGDYLCDCPACNESRGKIGCMMGVAKILNS
jgi:hypothetical protein